MTVEIYEIAVLEDGKSKVVETREGPLPDPGELVEVTLDGTDVEIEVSHIERIHKKAGLVNRVVLSDDANGGAMPFMA